MNTFKTLALTALLAGVTVAPLAANAEGVSNSGNATRSGATGATAGTNSMPGDASASNENTNAGTTATISSQTFSKLDADRSGTLSEAEFSKEASTSVKFGDLDANSDGTLTLSELQNR